MIVHQSVIDLKIFFISTCLKDNFDRSKKVRCDNFMYKKLTLFGTMYIRTIGTFFCLPLTGILSDRYGIQ